MCTHNTGIQVELREFEISMICIASSRPPSATQHNETLSQKHINKQEYL